MILSRFIEHLKHQHWTAVFLDFVIVVIGVFIGTNVTNWNDARKMHVRAETYTRRLLNDLHVEYEYDVSLRQYLTDAQKAAMSAFTGLTQGSDAEARDMLVNAFRATQFNWYERRRAAFDELVSSGELDLIADPGLRETAVRYYGNSTVVFEHLLADPRDSLYRRLFFQLLDPDVVLALQRDCGDRHYTSPGGVSGVFTMRYDCKLALDDAAVRKAVDALRNDAGVIPALRYQIFVYGVEIDNFSYMLDDTGIAALMARGTGKSSFPAPSRM
jgi:hypothetical protein